jgi:uncharacterized protein YdhG (YjbR/CyaY superfamily)
MANATFQSVDEYIASQPEELRDVLHRLPDILRTALPGAEEAISYQMPAYKMKAGAVLYFAGWARHYSVYPASAELVAAFKNELAPYEVSKGTIRFPLSQPVPVKLIADIAKFRATEIAERTKAKAAPRKR